MTAKLGCNREQELNTHPVSDQILVSVKTIAFYLDYLTAYKQSVEILSCLLKYLEK